MSDSIAHIDKDSWQSAVADSKVPVLVDFWAEWCAPCRALAPTLEALGKELGDKLKIVKVNVDESPDLAAQYQVRSIPTLLLFRDGTVQQQLVGNLPKSQLKSKIEAHLS